jgi:hypothetical protein
VNDEDDLLSNLSDMDDDDGPGGLVAQPKTKTRTKTKAPRVSTPEGEQMVRIILEESEEIPPTGQFVGLNGRTWIIRPGEEVEVPQGVVEVLQNAVTRVPVVDPQTRQVVDYRDRTRLPFRILSRRG